MRCLIFSLPNITALLLLPLSFTSTYLSSGDYRTNNINEVIGCGPASTAQISFDTERKMVPLPGWGKYSWEIEADNDSAKFYFNQGLNMFYSFHMQEAKASFLEAQRHDPGCAMALWGQTMASVGTINAPSYKFNDSALIGVLQKAEALAKSETERSIIRAQQLRFTTADNLVQKDLMVAYKTALQQLHARHPHNLDLAVLYADAMMLVNPRNWYDGNGMEKEGTAEIISLLADVLKVNPNHPAALHYYIHMVEPSTHPERARDEADRLLPMLPSVAHMVHMPSHIYIRTGDYKKAIRSNKDAVKGYTAYSKALKGLDGSRYLYFYHNVDMQGANAALLGNYEETKKAYGLNLSQFSQADSSFYSNPYMMNTVQFITVQLYLTDVRFGNWKNILLSKGPVTSNAYHQLLWQYGQGMAFAKTGNIQAAQQSLGMVKELMKDATLSNPRPSKSPAIDIANIAALILEGTLSVEQKMWDKAILQFEAAVNAEDRLRYSEPEDWRLPARQFLGQVYLLKGDPAKAQKIFEEDLVDHPQNYWASNGLQVALIRQNKKAAALKLKQQHKLVFSAAVTTKPLVGAVY